MLGLLAYNLLAWNALSEAERQAKERDGIAAWKAWVEKYQSAIVGMGGPLGKTKKITQRGEARRDGGELRQAIGRSVSSHRFQKV